MASTSDNGDRQVICRFGKSIENALVVWALKITIQGALRIGAKGEAELGCPVFGGWQGIHERHGAFGTLAFH